MSNNIFELAKSVLGNIALFASAMGGIAIVAFLIGWIQTRVALSSIGAGWLIHEYPASFFMERSIHYFIAVLWMCGFAILRFEVLYDKAGVEGVKRFPIVPTFLISLLLIVIACVIFGGFGKVAPKMNGIWQKIKPFLGMMTFTTVFIFAFYLIGMGRKAGFFDSQAAIIAISLFAFGLVLIFFPITMGNLEAHFQFKKKTTNLPAIELSAAAQKNYKTEGDDNLRLLLHANGAFYAVRFNKEGNADKGVIILDAQSVLSVSP